MKGVGLVLVVGWCVGLRAAEPVVSNVRVAQRPGAMLVDITYDVDYAGRGNLTMSVALSQDGGQTYAELTEGLSGDCGSGVVAGKDKRVLWEPDVSWLGRKADALQFRVTAMAKTADVSGTWTWTTRSLAGRESPPYSLKLDVAGKKVTGTLYYPPFTSSLRTPSVSRLPREDQISDGKLEGDELSFSVVREIGTLKFVTTYSGVVSGDTIKGKRESKIAGSTTNRSRSTSSFNRSTNFVWEARRQVK